MEEHNVYRIFLITFFVATVLATERVPTKSWEQYKDPSQAGFDAEKLAKAKTTWEAIPSSAFMVIVDGAVLVSWGDVERRFMCHSVRKSFMSALYGVFWDQRKIDLNKTLQDLGIDDYPEPLLPIEKQARILDLLKARSGIFHPAAYAGRTDSAERGSKGPGRYFAYNNWDFNTLVEILEQETGEKTFEAFDRYFAKPLNMEDWRLSDGYYHYEPDKSRYPAYPFRLSARDAARFGLLFAREGMWGQQRILSHHWVQRSTALYSDDNEVFGYGMLWWVARQAEFEKYGLVTALGVGNQAIAVLPKLNMVIVNRANTYDGEGTPTQALMGLIKEILDARNGEPNSNPDLIALEKQPKDRRLRTVAANQLVPYVGKWSIPSKPLGLETYGELELKLGKGTLEMVHPYRGTFQLYLQEDGSFFQEDQQAQLYPVYDSKNQFAGLANGFEMAQGSVFAMVDGKKDFARKLQGSIRDDANFRVKVYSSMVDFFAGKRKQVETKLAGDEFKAASPRMLERILNNLGYNLFLDQKTVAAGEVFELNTRLFPSAFNTWDSLAEFYLNKGDKEKSKAYYLKSLELNPENTNASTALENMDKTEATP